MKYLLVLINVALFACGDTGSASGEDDGGGGGMVGGGGAGGGGAGGAGSELSAAEYNTGVARVVCAKLFECCPGGIQLFADQEMCEGFISGISQIGLEEGLARGLVAYDGAQAKACIDALGLAFAGLECSDLNLDQAASPAAAAACDAVTIGQQGAGDTCAVELPEGATLSSSLYCSGDLACVDGTCEAPAQTGQACDDFEQNCAPGLYCDGASALCVVPGAIGAACAENDACASGRCDADVCAEPDICGLGM